MFGQTCRDVMDDQLIRTKWSAREAQLSQQHEEMLVASVSYKSEASMFVEDTINDISHPRHYILCNCTRS